MDPDDQPEKWLRSGAPAGLASLPLNRGVFPAVDHASTTDSCDLCVDEDVFTNYPGIDQDEVAQLEVTDLHRRGLLEAFDSIEDVRNYLGQKPVLSKVGVRTKIVGDKVKKRVIVDSCRSGVSDSTTNPERSVLPRVLDAVDDFMVQRQSANRESGTDFVVLDFTSAFFIIRLAWEERRFFVIRLLGKFFVFKVCAQGAAASPLGCSCLKAHAIHVPGNRTGDRGLRGRPVLHRHWLSRAAEQKNCHCPSVLAHPWFPVAIQEGTERFNSEVDRIYTSIDQHGTGNKHQARNLE